jgi:hypothetical protein
MATKIRQLEERLETWLKLSEEHTEILAAEADWRRILLKSAGQIDVCAELAGTQSGKDLLAAVTMARSDKLESFGQVRDLLRTVLQDMRTRGIGDR